ncbi:acyltransferase ChoActase/COT/CPT [Punctularia strigosozonata HHB-11173 SS5]|uniref:acyltransferase ChoActase/COT/CPT n=1 Tax=Punctularia strigosozonata (strain HHB-11173) TaxID=741275 RepID=UPI0004416E61|nr:acyltransferase ChoActase/COT/CPT [Punctularia strigosozonata HHB-11173 SS5]EIN09589.1 acyltransferase ChoActase/COT/CPT [Punctularia strigosozonata HHB-11173 SS5]
MAADLSKVSNATRPAGWKTLAPSLPNISAKDLSLPRLPVPPLAATSERLKASLLPLAHSKAEYDAATRKIDAFAGENGLGKVLQQRLEARAREDDREHWLEEWWDDGGYLGFRDSVVVNVSYYYGFDHPPAHLPRDPASRAAGIIRAAMLFRERLKRGEVQPEATKEGPLCMDTYRWMFDCSRIPGLQGLDWSTSYANENPEHVVVLRKGRFWKVTAAKDGQVLSTGDIRRQIEHIYQSTAQEYPAVGILTSNNRDVWAKDYAELAKDPHNASILRSVHSSAFAVCLDTEKPRGPIEHSRYLWHGYYPAAPILTAKRTGQMGLRNRWMDKPCQFVIFDNGEAGIVGEHSVMDGTPTTRMCDDALDDLYRPNFNHGSSLPSAPAPEPLDWHVLPATQKAIDEAAKAAYELISGQAMSYHLTPYGKAAIKRFGVSPDSWAQAIIQLAHRRLLSSSDKVPKPRNGGTYEAASVRKFHKGRTEAIRVVSSEMDAWVQSMDDAGASADEKRLMLMNAAKKHVELAKAAGNGHGIDRHMLGLKKSLREGEALPEIFSDPLYARSSYWILSTSAIFSKHFPTYGWGEVVPDGFGVAYMTGYDGECNHLQLGKSGEDLGC